MTFIVAKIDGLCLLKHVMFTVIQKRSLGSISRDNAMNCQYETCSGSCFRATTLWRTIASWYAVTRLTYGKKYSLRTRKSVENIDRHSPFGQWLGGTIKIRIHSSPVRFKHLDEPSAVCNFFRTRDASCCFILFQEIGKHTHPKVEHKILGGEIIVQRNFPIFWFSANWKWKKREKILDLPVVVACTSTDDWGLSLGNGFRHGRTDVAHGDGTAELLLSGHAAGDLIVAAVGLFDHALVRGARGQIAHLKTIRKNPTIFHKRCVFYNLRIFKSINA